MIAAMTSGVRYERRRPGMSDPTLRNRRRLTISTEGNRRTGSATNAVTGSVKPTGQAKTVAAGMLAAAGLGRPTKYRLSPSGACRLNRARRTAVAVNQRNATAQPRRPSGSRPQAKTSVAGAMPNEMTSASESSCTPNSLVDPVARAIRPSRRSSTIATPMKGAAMA